MVAMVILMFLLFKPISALPGFYTTGTHFSVAFPSKNHLSGEIFISTELLQATVKLRQPKRLLGTNIERKETVYKLLGRNKYVKHPVPTSLFLPRSGIYPSYIIQSQEAIKVFALVIKRDKTASEAFIAMPEESCYKSYYVTTGIGFPIIMVFSFTSRTKLDIEFPDYEHEYKFNEACAASETCTPGRKVQAVLEPDSVWYFNSRAIRAQFQNTLITSDNPVFVVSGSTKCNSHSKDMCLSNMKPTVTWGKEYYVPSLLHNQSADIVYRVNAKTFPILLRKYQENPTTPINIDSYQKTYDLGTQREPTIFKSNTTFGLYIFTQFSQGTSLVNVIPTEQWSQGGVLLVRPLWSLLDRRSYLMIVRTDTTNLLKQKKNHWTKDIKINGMYYFHSSVDFTRLIGPYYTSRSKSAVMLYLTGMPNNASAFAMPYDYYQGEIYAPNCTPTKPVSGDGIDNNCDGYIDEHRKRASDDGSGDFVSLPKHSRNSWSEWKSYCRIECGEKVINRSIRSCGNEWSRFNPFPCRGPDTKCDPGGKCPTKCQGQPITEVCECQASCATCQNNTNECEGCKPGYMLSPYCQNRCPNGWKGIGCSQIDPDGNRTSDYDSGDDEENYDDIGEGSEEVDYEYELKIHSGDDEEKHETSKAEFDAISIALPTAIALGVIFFLSLLLLLLILMLRRRREKRERERTEKERKEREEGEKEEGKKEEGKKEGDAGEKEEGEDIEGEEDEIEEDN